MATVSMDWVDVSNIGISHFGISPDLLPLDHTRFDTFHMQFSITRKLMINLREFILNQSTEIISQFQDVLSRFWNDFLLFVWRNNKKFTSFNGNELSAFVHNISSITEFIESHFVSSDQTSNSVRGLILWKEIYEFVSISVIETSKREQYIYLL